MGDIVVPTLEQKRPDTSTLSKWRGRERAAVTMHRALWQGFL